MIPGDRDAHAPGLSAEALGVLDGEVAGLIGLEEERQNQRLILIPSESIAPAAVREALGSVFTNIYAEGYPASRMVRQSPGDLADHGWNLARYARFGNRRFYRGAEFADFVEALAQRRCAQCYAAPEVPPDRIFANVQPLSGAAANNAVYEAFLSPGDTVMGMGLSVGGHLTHGSPFNRSGKRYHAVPYGVSATTAQLDYDEIMALALTHRPRMIIAGYTSYTWAPDWARFREICDAVGDCILLADIAHPAGMVIAGEYPSPVGWADVITLTTHKTLCGPRGAVIMTTDRRRASAVDRAVFPGEQGGPHVNAIAAMAVAFLIAQTTEFRDLQRRIVANSRALAEGLTREGVPLAYGGTEVHYCVADLSALETDTGWPLKGDTAARILDLVGLVVNKNTIPGDESAAEASGIRIGTPWVTQRGLTADHMAWLAAIIARTLRAIRPFEYASARSPLARGKVDFDALLELRAEARGLTEVALPGLALGSDGWEPARGQAAAQPPRCGTADDLLATVFAWHPEFGSGPVGQVTVRGDRALAFLQATVTSDIGGLQAGQSAHTCVLDGHGVLIDDPLVVCESERQQATYLLITHAAAHQRLTDWLRGLSDGYTVFDTNDILRKVPGPVVIADRGVSGGTETAGRAQRPHPTGLDLYDGGGAERLDLTKPYFVGQRAIEQSVRIPTRLCQFEWEEQPAGALQRTALHDQHRQLSARMVPFAGWEMPLQYASMSAEHRAARTAAGLFDIAHMGVLEVAGSDAATFLDLLTTAYTTGLEPGESAYGFVLDLAGVPIDDIIVYCRGAERYMLVVNAVNTARVSAWLEGAATGEYVIDAAYPHRAMRTRVRVRSLGSGEAGPDQRVGLALQGPASDAVLLRLRGERPQSSPLSAMRRFTFIEDTVAGIPALISNTGYTGEPIGYELYLHPDHAPALWQAILEAGADVGVQPCGLGARDSTRTQAGLPLYGHELAGPEDILPGAAGYGAYVKLHKPFFVGRERYIERDVARTREIIRFKADDPGGPVIRPGDLVASRRGEYVGTVTSCSPAGARQFGMAHVDCRMQTPGAPVLLFSRRQMERAAPMPAPADLAPGAAMPLAEPATVLTRFPVREGAQTEDLCE